MKQQNKLLTSSENKLFTDISNFLKQSKECVIIAPYIKKSALKSLQEDIKEKSKITTIVTSWRPQDIALGASDIKIFDLCKENDITLLINNQIHLKAYIHDLFNSCIVSSANLSNRGLGLSENYNYELGTIVDNLTIEDKSYFDQIIEDAIVVTDSYYEQIKAQIQRLELKKDMPEKFDIKEEKEKNFLLTSLPMSADIETLKDIYLGNLEGFTEEDIRCAEHDFRLYKILKGKDEEFFIKTLKKNFFDNMFIREFLLFNDNGKYFGELATWIHNKCTTVPTPRRFEIKQTLQIIYKFTVSLDSKSYEIVVPKAHSEMLRRK